MTLRMPFAKPIPTRPPDELDAGPKSRTIKTTGRLERAEDFREVIVAYRDGFPVRLKQIASVINSIEDDKNVGWYNQSRGIVLAILRQPGANTVQVIDRIRELLPTFKAQLPGGVKLDILYDRSISIRESLHDVQFTLVLAVALVVLVIFIFLRNVRATLIPSAAIPLSIIGTFCVMYLLDFSVNNFSLMALILAVGFVVDDAIVVLENIVRHMEKGETPFEAAIKGGREIGFTILSMTLSLAAVFIPVLFMGGILGRLLNEFAVTIAVAILISGFVSLSLTPMLCSRFLKGAHGASNNALFRWSESVFNTVLAGYQKTLRLAMRHHVVVSLAALAMALVTVWMFVKAPKGFLPNEDTGRILISTEAEQGVAFEKMIELQQKAAGIVSKNPAVESFMSRIGGGGSAQIEQYRSALSNSQAAKRTSSDRSDHRPAAKRSFHNSGLESLPAKSACDPHWRRPDEEPLSVYSFRARSRCPIRSGRQDGGIDESNPGDRGCDN